MAITNNGCAVNLDSDFIWETLYNKDFNLENLPAILDGMVDIYANKGVSDIIYCNLCQDSVTPTDVFSYAGDKYEMTEENGIPVDYKGVDRVRVHYELAKLGFDAYDYIVKKSKEVGLKTWMSLRMNDCHCCNEETSHLRSDLFYEAKEKGWYVGEKTYGTYFGRCFDYAVPEVREKFLAYIEEQILRYDVDGLELDYTREILCFDFKKNPECYLIMTEFVKQVKEIVKKAEQKHGHKIEIMVRTVRDMEQSKKHGIDTLEWAKLGLIDIVVPAPRFITSDTGIEVDKWVAAMEPYGVDVYVGLEGMNIENIPNDAETIKAQTVQFIDSGAKKVYLFNCTHWADLWFPNESCKDMFPFAGDAEKSRKGTRRHIVTFQDDMFSITDTPWHPLPKGFVISTSVEVLAGKIGKNAKVKAYVGMRPYDMPLGGQLNSKDILPTDEGREDAFVLKDKRWQKEEIRVFDVPAELFKDTNKHKFDFFSPSYGNITYFELKVEE